MVTAGQKQGRELGWERQIPAVVPQRRAVGMVSHEAKVPLRLMGSAEVRWTLKGLHRNWARMEERAWSEGGCWAEMPDLDGYQRQKWRQSSLK